MSLATGLVAGIQRSHRDDPTSVSGCELETLDASPHKPRQSEIKSKQTGISLVVQLLGLCSPSAGGPGQGTRPHTL